MAPRTLRRDEVAAQLRALGVRPGGVLLVHASFRAVRPVEGGPEGLLAALRDAVGEDGTLVLPSWTGRDDEPFDPRRTPCAPDLGVLAEAFWRLPGVLRSDHPFAFAAEGPRAAEVVEGPLPVPPHVPGSPVGRVHDLDGQVLLLGVGHEADTTLHLAEQVARVPYGVPKSITVLVDGVPARLDYVENDVCGQRFPLADGWLRARGVQREGPVGHARARLVRSQDVVEVVAGVLAREPFTFLHAPGEGCAECDAARAGAAPAVR